SVRYLVAPTCPIVSGFLFVIGDGIAFRGEHDADAAADFPSRLKQTCVEIETHRALCVELRECVERGDLALVVDPEGGRLPADAREEIGILQARPIRDHAAETRAKERACVAVGARAEAAVNKCHKL